MIIVVNKPYGILSQFNVNPDYPNQRTLTELNLPPELQPVGRLDMDSEGLLLLTDEKKLEHQLINPENSHPRTYLVQVDGTPNERDLDLLREGGLEIRGCRVKPCRVRLLEEKPTIVERVPAVDPVAAGRSAWLEMTLTEGRNRQVRRMTAKIGCPTLRLIRVKIGAFVAKDLKMGEWRVVSEVERALLFRK